MSIFVPSIALSPSFCFCCCGKREREGGHLKLLEACAGLAADVTDSLIPEEKGTHTHAHAHARVPHVSSCAQEVIKSTQLSFFFFCLFLSLSPPQSNWLQERHTHAHTHTHARFASTGVMSAGAQRGAACCHGDRQAPSDQQLLACSCLLPFHLPCSSAPSSQPSSLAPVLFSFIFLLLLLFLCLCSST